MTYQIILICALLVLRQDTAAQHYATDLLEPERAAQRDLARWRGDPHDQALIRFEDDPLLGDGQVRPTAFAFQLSARSVTGEPLLATRGSTVEWTTIILTMGV
jgi:hypothetical protein